MIGKFTLYNILGYKLLFVKFVKKAHRITVGSTLSDIQRIGLVHTHAATHIWHSSTRRFFLWQINNQCAHRHCRTSN